MPEQPFPCRPRPGALPFGASRARGHPCCVSRVRRSHGRVQCRNTPPGASPACYGCRLPGGCEARSHRGLLAEPAAARALRRHQVNCCDWLLKVICGWWPSACICLSQAGQGLPHLLHQLRAAGAALHTLRRERRRPRVQLRWRRSRSVPRPARGPQWLRGCTHRSKCASTRVLGGSF